MFHSVPKTIRIPYLTCSILPWYSPRIEHVSEYLMPTKWNTLTGGSVWVRAIGGAIGALPPTGHKVTTGGAAGRPEPSPPGPHRRGPHHLGLPPGPATWACHLALLPGPATWPCHLGLPPGPATWLHHLAPPPGSTTWPHHLAPPPGSTTWLHHLAAGRSGFAIGPPGGGVTAGDRVTTG